MSKTTTIIISVVLIALIGGFAGGVQYQKSKGSTTINRQGVFGEFQSLTQEQRDRMRQQFGGAGGPTDGRGMIRISGGAAVAGEILSKGETSFTVKLPDGGSKIVLFSTSTQIGKTAVGASEDLVVGESVIVNGTANGDGSITAQNIQIRPIQPLSNPQ